MNSYFQIERHPTLTLPLSRDSFELKVMPRNGIRFNLGYVDQFPASIFASMKPDPAPVPAPGQVDAPHR